MRGNTLRSLFVALILIAVAVATAPSACADPPNFAGSIPGFGGNLNLTAGVIHCHTTFSDGIYSIEEVARMAKAHGAKFLVVTDHFEDIELNEGQYEQVGNKVVASLRSVRRTSKQCGIAAYIKACRDATKKVGILVVPGVEVGLGTDRDWVYDAAGDKNWDNKIHMLAVGCITPELALLLQANLAHSGTTTYSRSEKVVRLETSQVSTSKTLHDAGLAVIIAHPYLRDMIHDFHYTLYKNRVDYVDGIEFFNGSDPNDENSMEAMGFIKRDSTMAPFKNMAVTSGCDFHGFPAVSDEGRFDHQTLLPVTLPSIWNNDNFEEGCKTVANALQGNDACVAGVKQTATSSLTDPLGTLSNLGSALSGLALRSAVYQDGEKVFGGLDVSLDDLDTNRPFYFHIPGLVMARVDANDQDRQAPFGGIPFKRVEPPTSGPRAGHRVDPPAEPRAEVPERLGDLQIENPANRWPIPVSFKAVGGTGELELMIENRTDRTQTLRFEPGMLFVVEGDPMGETYQPLVVIESCRFEVESNQRGTGRVDTLCANKRVGSPPTGLNLVYVGTNPVLGSVIQRAQATGSSIQNAIWEYTNAQMWYGSSLHLKRIAVNNKTGKTIRVSLEWHDTDGWHSDPNSYWEFAVDEKAILALPNDDPFWADKIRIWAKEEDGRQTWGDRQKEVNATTDGDIFEYVFR